MVAVLKLPIQPTFDYTKLHYINSFKYFFSFDEIKSPNCGVKKANENEKPTKSPDINKKKETDVVWIRLQMQKENIQKSTNLMEPKNTHHTQYNIM